MSKKVFISQEEYYQFLKMIGSIPVILDNCETVKSLRDREYNAGCRRRPRKEWCERGPLPSQRDAHYRFGIYRRLELNAE